MITKISRNYLEIKSIDELNYSKSPNNKCELFEINPPDFQINKFFYKQIGNDHRWIDRLVWDDQKWISYVSNPNVKTYVLKENDDLVKLKSNDFSYEVGFGIDFYMKYFKLSPVIVLAIGTNNILIKEEGNLFSESLDKLNSKILQVSVTFE